MRLTTAISQKLTRKRERTFDDRPFLHSRTPNTKNVTPIATHNATHNINGFCEKCDLKKLLKNATTIISIKYNKLVIIADPFSAGGIAAN